MQITGLDIKINQYFAGLVVRKDLVKTVKGNAIVPSYVLEYLLGQYCATDDKESIETGIQTVKEILAKHYVHRNEAGLIRSTIKEMGRHKVIDKIRVTLNDKDDCYEASFANLGLKKVLVDSDTVKAHSKLLVSGVWCIADIEYEFTEDKRITPWVMSSIKPIQLSHFDFEKYLQARQEFSLDEWIDLLIQSIGFNPDILGKRNKLFQLTRLIPFCERNYNLLELGPKGTGKSHIYSEFSPHGILISGGEVTIPKLFVNNVSGKLGLVGYWDTVAFDEFAGKKKKTNKALVDIMKNYMANKSFSRGVETLGAEASMVFVGNTQHTVPYMLKHANLFTDLPETFYDSAFLDRLHFYIPGWEIDIIRKELLSDSYGFVVDYIAEILRSLRKHDFSDVYQSHFTLSSTISTRDSDAINKTFSGLMKILFPNSKASIEEIEEILIFAIEGRKRVKDQLMRIDSTYADVDFSYTNNVNNESNNVSTLEEQQYTKNYHHVITNRTKDSTKTLFLDKGDITSAEIEKPQERQFTFKENQTGVSFDRIFAAYLKGADKITITDPSIHVFYQARNLMEFMETIAKNKNEEEEVAVHLITSEDELKNHQQREYLEKIQQSCSAIGIRFSWQFDNSGINACHIVTDHGWKIFLDKGLDVFQHFEMNDAFSFVNRLQQYRLCKAFEVKILNDNSQPTMRKNDPHQ